MLPSEIEALRACYDCVDALRRCNETLTTFNMDDYLKQVRLLPDTVIGLLYDIPHEQRSV